MTEKGWLRTYVPTYVRTNVSAEGGAAARIPWSGRDGAIAWAEFSPYSSEAGIAGRRFVAYMDRLPLPALWYAVAEAAAEGHHAAGALIEPYLRSRCARIGEALREIEKADLAAVPERLAKRQGQLKKLDVDALLRGMA